jgi:hypothetical protein
MIPTAYENAGTIVRINGWFWMTIGGGNAAIVGDSGCKENRR